MPNTVDVPMESAYEKKPLLDQPMEEAKDDKTQNANTYLSQGAEGISKPPTVQKPMPAHNYPK